MTVMKRDDRRGIATSPGGWTFGIENWDPGEPRLTGVTFYTDGTASVSDQHGNPVRGTFDPKTGKKMLFAPGPPQQTDAPGFRKQYATHAQVIAAMAEERVDWRELTWAGFPQLPYDDLKKLFLDADAAKSLPPWPFGPGHSAEAPICSCIRCCVRDPKLRADLLRAKAEWDNARKAEADGDDDLPVLKSDKSAALPRP